MALVVAQLSIELVEALRPLVPRIKRHDRSLADQLVRAASSVALKRSGGRAFGSREPAGAVLFGGGERE
jgi:hypothetical protein